MANIKISQLPAASTVTADVDVLPIVHSGVTQKVTPDQIVNEVLLAPGPIGGTAADTGSFTDLTAAGNITATGLNKTINLSPSGTGTVVIQPVGATTIRPTALGSIDNCTIGGTTPQAGSFLSLTSSSTTTLNGTTIPASKTLVDTNTAQTLSNKTFSSLLISDYDANNTYTISASSPGLSADRTLYLPVLSTNDTFVFEAATQTLTNKSISGTTNSLSNIGNSALTNSSITLGSTAISLGGTASSIAGLALSGASGAFTTLSSTGNTTLGDASGDTLTLNGTAVSIPNNLNFDSNTLFIDAANNRVGIGTSSPGTLLSVLSGTANTVGDSITSAVATVTGPSYNFGTAGNPAALQVMSNSTLGADVGATIGLGGRYTGTQFAQFAIIKGAKENAVDGNFSTYLAFGTRVNGGQISERMRIDSSGYVGVNTTSPSTYNSMVSAYNNTGGVTSFCAVSGSAVSSVIEIRDGAATPNRWWLLSGLGTPTDGIFSIYDRRQSVSRLAIGSSGNVGIGTSSPIVKFQVGAYQNAGTAGTAMISGANVSVTNNAGMFTVGTTDSIAANIGGSIGFTANGTLSGYPTGSIAGRRENATANNYASYLQFATTDAGGAVAERLRLDSSGNLGLGVTPSSWDSGGNLTMKSGGTIFSNTGSLVIGSNAYYNAGWKYAANGYASNFNQGNGAFSWQTASNNTSGAGAGLTFTTAMTLDASGQLMLGTTTASTYANTGKVLTVSGSAFNTAPANLYLQGNASAPGRGFDSTEVFALNGVSSANEITRITGTGSNGFRAYIKIIVTGHTSGIGNGTNIKEFYWDGGIAAPVQISTYTDGQVQPITFNYSTNNVLIIYVASANGTNELKGVMKVEWMMPNDFNGNTWVIS